MSISCNASVTGLAYLPQMKVLWVAAGTYLVNYYEPKLGANVRLCVLCVRERGRERQRERETERDRERERERGKREERRERKIEEQERLLYS